MALESRIVPPIDRIAVRQQVLDVIASLLEDALFIKDDPTPDPPKLFDSVKRGCNLDDITPSETPCAAVEETNETVIPGMGYTQKQIRVFVNFKPVKQQGIDASALINYYFGRIEEVLVTDPHLSDTALSIDPVGNSIQSNGLSDPEPGGIFYFDVDFRHYQGQPFDQI